MSDQILKPTLTIKVDIGTDEVPEFEEFIFRVPTPLEKARLGVREASIRRFLDPSSSGYAFGVDDETFFLIRGMAIMETLLEKANVTWPFTEDKSEGKTPTLRFDIDNLPVGKDEVIVEVGREFQAALTRFHRDRAGHKRPTVSEAMDRIDNPADL